MTQLLDSEVWQARRSGAELARPMDIRDAYDRDRARLIHSAAFRRLQAKTQVLGISEGDFHRTRLTHSMEVAQISRSLTRFIARIKPELEYALPPLELVEAIALGHDLGHPPFGHGGEVALNSMMWRHGGFEANGQTLRILARLEAHTAGFGLDLTRRMLLGILKYPAPYSKVTRKIQPQTPENYIRLKNAEWRPPKSYLDIDQGVVDWLLAPFANADHDNFVALAPSGDPHFHSKPKYKNLDSSIVNLADDIAYGTHDLEDGIMLRLISREDWREAKACLDKDWARRFELTALEEMLFDTGLKSCHNLKQAIGGMVNAFISSVKVLENPLFESPLLRFNVGLEPAAADFLEALHDFVFKNVISAHAVETITYRGQYMMLMIFDALSADPKRLLPHNFTRHLESCDETSVKRMVCDYMGGMTDGYATRLYERLFMPRHGTIFERL